ncbi:zinc finger protein ZFP2-like [Anthonomus grandis grandis]|uniref:zinc finger protein ZFP2-like n=1 Tax=Anthonomus grandis grandis TaxID=2921223 RepID=UPI002166B6BA|nr:zinc finger protein ZFP2-like [Anthonomus grandis grandis]
MEIIKAEVVHIDINKLCRTCLNESNDMRSIFLPESSTGGNDILIADMLMNFTKIQISNEDGLPVYVCLQCAMQIGRAYYFKQLCEQSDASIRQYLGKPLNNTKQDTLSADSLPEQNSDFSQCFLDVSIDSSTSDSEEDEFRQIDTLPAAKVPQDPTSEKIMAQQQLLKLARSQKSKNRKKKNKRDIEDAVPKKRVIGVCNVCKKKFRDMKFLRKHLRSHIEDRPFKCDQCSRAFTEENYLNNHLRSHLPEEQKPHQCSICKKRFFHPSMLQKHILRHNNERPYVCQICNKGCFAENSLVKHMKIHEKKKGDPRLLKHICDYCKTEFPSAELLSVHIKQHTGDKPYVCNICGKCFPQRFNLELHVRTHTGERPFTCEVCKKGYVSKASLKIHMRTHTNERPFACDFCGKAFRQSGDLTSHKRLHGTDKPIECDVCQKRFTTVMKLKYHMRNHTGERPYVCTVCNRGFTVNTILIRHMRVHSGERPYVCFTCGKAFSQTSTLNNHMKVHANNLDKGDHGKCLIKYPADEKYVHHPIPHNHITSQPPTQQQISQSQQPIIMDTQGTRIPIQNSDARMIRDEPLRLLQVDAIAHDTTRLLADTAHLLADNRTILTTEESRIMVGDPTMLVNVVEPTRLLVQDNAGRNLSNEKPFGGYR